MKNIIVLVFISFVAFSGFGQAPRSHEQITNDAYLDYVNKGNPPSQWPQYQSKYVEDYKNKKYNITNGGGEYQRKTTYVAGLIRNSAGQTIGNYSNGQVLNSNNQPIGYLNRGQFMSQQGAYSNCVGTIQGNKIMSCQGSIYYTINSSSIYSMALSATSLTPDNHRFINGYIPEAGIQWNAHVTTVFNLTASATIIYLVGEISAGTSSSNTNSIRYTQIG